MDKLKGNFTSALITIDNLEPACRDQIKLFLEHPAFTNPVAIMPDAHAGKGAVIGFTMRMGEKLVPNVVGVDIGCGMLSFNVGNLFKDVDFEKFDRKLRQQIPTGVHIHDKPVFDFRHDFPFEKVTQRFLSFSNKFKKHFAVNPGKPHCDMEWVESRAKEIDIDPKRFYNSIGTLGGGNHFIEVGRDESGDYWVTIHSGSRNLGKQVCNFHQRNARRNIKKMGLSENIRDLEYLEGVDAARYLFDMIFAQTYAEVNRKQMKKSVLEVLEIDEDSVKETIETVHNFIDFDDWIIRKGAIRSYQGEKMIIPFNMRDGILLCEGKSNREWNYSAPHGAGRVMSRHQAQRELSLKDFEESMKSIFSSSVCREPSTKRRRPIKTQG